jgi:hypothetical protein
MAVIAIPVILIHLRLISATPIVLHVRLIAYAPQQILHAYLDSIRMAQHAMAVI